MPAPMLNMSLARALMVLVLIAGIVFVIRAANTSGALSKPNGTIGDLAPLLWPAAVAAFVNAAIASLTVSGPILDRLRALASIATALVTGAASMLFGFVLAMWSHFPKC